MDLTERGRPNVDPRRLVFIGGLHRSGTTPLARMLAQHPDASGLSDTYVREDEGQHLQSVYPRDGRLGGVGRFARSPEAHVTEDSELVRPENAARLLEAWTPYWDLDRRLLVEKSPRNMLMGRFLQAVFPGSTLIVLVRHPAVVSLASRKWSPRLVSRRGRGRLTMRGMFENWIAAYETLRADLPHLDRVHVVYYEDLVACPTLEMARIHRVLDLRAQPGAAGAIQDHSDAYRTAWTAGSGPVRRRLEAACADRVRALGYDLQELCCPVSRPLAVGNSAEVRADVDR